MRKLYVAVPVEEELPPIGETVIRINEAGQMYTMTRKTDNEEVFLKLCKAFKVCFWLREVEVGSSVSSDAHTREVAEKAVDEALDVVFKDCIITDIATDCVEQSGKQFLKDKILARLFPPSKP